MAPAANMTDVADSTLKTFAKREKTELVGSMSTLFGAKATIGGIPYNCLARRWWDSKCLTMPFVRLKVPLAVVMNLYVPIGILGLSQAVLSCINSRIARFTVGAGEVGTMLQLCGLKASGNAHYVGLLSSNVDVPVRGAVGESIVLELLRGVKEQEVMPSDKKSDGNQSELFEIVTHDSNLDSGRTIYVIWAKIDGYDLQRELRVDQNIFEVGEIASAFAVVMCVAACVWMGISNYWWGFALVIIGMFLNACLAGLLRSLEFELPTSNPLRGAPDGDVVVQLMDEPDVLCVLQGPEANIQRLLQKPVFLKPGTFKQKPLSIVCMILYVYAGCIWLGMPYMPTIVQVIWAGLVCLGAFADLCKGSFDCKRSIAEKVISKSTKYHVTKTFNRTAAVASICMDPTTKRHKWEYMNSLKAANLLPTTGDVWTKWWQAFEFASDVRTFESNVVNLLASLDEEEHGNLTREKIDDNFKLFTELTTALVAGLRLQSPIFKNDQFSKWGKDRKGFRERCGNKQNVGKKPSSG